MAPDRRVLRIFAFSLITMLFLAESGVCGGLFESAWSKQMKRIHQLIKDEPANAHAYFERAGIYSSQISTCLNCNDDDKTLFEKALADYTKAVTLNNCFYEAYMGRSALYEDKGLYDLAIADLDQVNRIYPGYGAAYERKAFIYEKTGQYDKAAAAYTALLRRQREIYFKRASAFLKIKQYDLAIGDLNEFLKEPVTSFNTLSAYYYRGIAKYAIGSYKDALEDLENGRRFEESRFSQLTPRDRKRFYSQMYEEFLALLEQPVTPDKLEVWAQMVKFFKARL